VTIRLDAFQDFVRQGAGRYREVDDVEFDDGTTVGRYMPGLVGGKRLRATVIPHARPGGGSRAYDPHKPPHRRVHIDPHLEGQSVVVDLTLVTKDLAQEAMELGQEFADTHSDKVAGIEALRLRSSAAFHLLGAQQRDQSRQAALAEQSQQPRTVQVPSPPPQVAVAEGPRMIRAASFGAGPAPQVQQAPHAGGLLDQYTRAGTAHSPATEDVAGQAAAQPPVRQVTFAVPGFGQHQAYYHRVIVSDQQLVLVWDERYQGGGRFLPDRIQGSFAARIDGDPLDYQLVWPDQKFHDPDTGRTYCTLLIEDRVPNRES
jgi:hypothetical protein